jgi:hypothetical protein
MDTSSQPRAFGRLDATLGAELARAAEQAPGPAARVLETLQREEVETSCALAGAPLQRLELAALIERGLATGNHPLASYLIASGYAAAAALVARTAAPRRGRPFLELAEIVALHAAATRLQPELEPGRFRRRTLPSFRAGVVAPPFWLVPREMSAFVERYASGPPARTPAPLWLAGALERFDRIRPFSGANGRTGRLVGNLLLRRLGLPPFALRPRDAGTFLRALGRADGGDPWPLATLVGRSLLSSVERLAGAAGAPRSGGERLVPLASLAAGRERAALYKAIQRGRLRVVRRGAALWTRPDWLEEYRASH